MTTLEAAYLAGLIDGEGSIGLFISRSPSRSNYAVLARLTIGMCDEPLIRWLQRTTDSGTVTTWRQQNQTWKPVWVVTWNGYSAADVIEQVWPYLRLKRPQAAKLLEWVKLSKSWRRRLGGRGHHDRKYPDHVWQQAEAIAGEIRALNVRGKPPSKNVCATVAESCPLRGPP